MPWIWVLPATILTGGAAMAALMVRRITSARDDLKRTRHSLDSLGQATRALADSTAALHSSDAVIRNQLASDPGENSGDR